LIRTKMFYSQKKYRYNKMFIYLYLIKVTKIG